MNSNKKENVNNETQVEHTYPIWHDGYIKEYVFDEYVINHELFDNRKLCSGVQSRGKENFSSYLREWFEMCEKEELYE